MKLKKYATQNELGNTDKNYVNAKKSLDDKIVGVLNQDENKALRDEVMFNSWYREVACGLCDIIDYTENKKVEDLTTGNKIAFIVSDNPRLGAEIATAYAMLGENEELSKIEKMYKEELKNVDIQYAKKYPQKEEIIEVISDGVVDGVEETSGYFARRSVKWIVSALISGTLLYGGDRLVDYCTDKYDTYLNTNQISQVKNNE